MSKLKKLSKEDLNTILEFFLSSLDNNLLNNINFKEINDLNLDVKLNYLDNKLDVDLDIGIDLDTLSDIDSKNVNIAIDKSYADLDSFIEGNFKK